MTLHDTALQDLERLAQRAQPTWNAQVLGGPEFADALEHENAFIQAASPDVVLSLIAAAREAARLRAALEDIAGKATSCGTMARNCLAEAPE